MGYSILLHIYWYLCFAKNMDKNTGKNISKHLGGRYSQVFLDHAINPATDALESASKRAIQKQLNQ